MNKIQFEVFFRNAIVDNMRSALIALQQFDGVLRAYNSGGSLSRAIRFKVGDAGNYSLGIFNRLQAKPTVYGQDNCHTTSHIWNGNSAHYQRLRRCRRQAYT